MALSPDRLLAAYLNAVYEFTADDVTFRLRPGDTEARGVAWLNEVAVRWTYVTACNPRSVALCEAENEARHENLARDLKSRGWRYLPARGVDPSGHWPPEPGFLVLDRPLVEVAELARALEQNALLHGGRDRPPLVMVLEPGWRDSVAQAGEAAAMAHEASGKSPAPRTDGPCLEAANLGFARGPDWIFRELDFRVTPGRIVLAEGANGSGKTTLVRVLAGLLEFHEGGLAWNGEPVTPGSERLRRDMLYLGHRLSVRDELSALENLSFVCGLHGRDPGEGDCERALARLGLGGLQDVATSRLSAGQRKRVALARLALDSRPLWLLDEPYANLDREGAGVVSALIAEHAAAGGLTVLTAHEGLTPKLDALERLPLANAHA